MLVQELISIMMELGFNCCHTRHERSFKRYKLLRYKTNVTVSSHDITISIT